MKRIRTDKQPSTFGYLRVSTAEQDLEKNKAAILTFANQKDFGRVEWCDETVSGTVDWRKRRIGLLVDELDSGDRLIVSEITRLSRSAFQLFAILETALNKGIAVYSLKEGWELNGSIQSKVVAMAFGMAGEIERALISARTKEGLAARKAAGVRLGRPPGPGKSLFDPHRAEIVERIRNGDTKTDIARSLGSTAANLINWMKKNSINPFDD